MPRPAKLLFTILGLLIALLVAIIIGHVIILFAQGTVSFTISQVNGAIILQRVIA